MTRELTHERCAHRCCCLSWSCEPHRADCENVTGKHVYAGIPVVLDRSVPRGTFELRNGNGTLAGRVRIS